MTEQELEQKLEQELMADLEAKAQELLPCPFCGARPDVDQIAPHAHPDNYTIKCTVCPAGFIAEPWERVKKLWNTRRERA